MFTGHVNLNTRSLDHNTIRTIYADTFNTDHKSIFHDPVVLACIHRYSRVTDACKFIESNALVVTTMKYSMSSQMLLMTRS